MQIPLEVKLLTFKLSTLLVVLCGYCMVNGAQPLAQDYTVVYHNTDRGSYIDGCGLVRMGDDYFVAVVPVVQHSSSAEDRKKSHGRVHIMESRDNGKTWRNISELNYFQAVPWIHEGGLYLFGMKDGTEFRNDDLQLLRSDDQGKTWFTPVTLFKGHFWNCQTGMVIRDNKLYWAVDDLSFGMDFACPRVVSGDLSGDVMNPKAWRMSPTMSYPPVPDLLINPKFADLRSSYLEPNVVEVKGQLRVVTAVKPKAQSTAGISAVLNLTDEGNTPELTFVQYHPMPGGQLKFCILWDDVSQMYWATGNQVVDSQGIFDWWETGRKTGDFKGKGETHGGNDRRFLMLYYSLDALNWFQAGCIAQASNISQSFMYATPVIDGNDLAIISRSSINALNQHDADHATFHRVKEFRKLALNLVPESER